MKGNKRKLSPKIKKSKRRKIEKTKMEGKKD